MVRRRGGPPDRPYTEVRSDLHFKVFGKAGQRNFNIQLLLKGKHRNLLMYQREGLGLQLRQAILGLLLERLLVNTPVVTGDLKASYRIKRGQAIVVEGGPESRTIKSRPYKPHPRYGKAANERRRQKKTKVSRFYGRFANRRSRRAGGFIERSMTEAARKAQPLIRKFAQQRKQIDNIGDLARGRVNLSNIGRP